MLKKWNNSTIINLSLQIRFQKRFSAILKNEMSGNRNSNRIAFEANILASKIPFLYILEYTVAVGGSWGGWYWLWLELQLLAIFVQSCHALLSRNLLMVVVLDLILGTDNKNTKKE